MKQRTGHLVPVIFATATLVFAQTTPSQKTGTTSPRPSHEAFMTEVDESCISFVELGRLATEKASDAAVKSFGQRMVADHGRMMDELEKLAQRKNITLPTEMNRTQMATRDRLSKLSGAAFDQAYMREEVAAHRKDVAAFRREATRGSDAQLRAWVAKARPMIEDHLRQAESTLKKVEETGAPGEKKTPGK